MTYWGRTDPDELQARVQTMLARGTVTSVDDALMMQHVNLEMEDGFKPTQVEHIHPYGVSTHPIPGDKTDAIVAALGGNRDHMVMLGVSDRQYRMKVAQGEVAIHDDQGQVVHLTRDGIKIESSKPITTKSSAGITLEGPLTFKGDITHEGNMTTTGVHTDSNGLHV